MPWEHCERTIDDGSVCPGCGIDKAAWTVQFDVTRTFKVTRSQALRLEVVDGTDAPVAGEPFRVELSDGSVVEGSTDDDGLASVRAAGGPCTIVFPRRGRGEVVALRHAEARAGDGAGAEGAAFVGPSGKTLAFRVSGLVLELLDVAWPPGAQLRVEGLGPQVLTFDVAARWQAERVRLDLPWPEAGSKVRIVVAWEGGEHVALDGVDLAPVRAALERGEAPPPLPFCWPRVEQEQPPEEAPEPVDDDASSGQRDVDLLSDDLQPAETSDVAAEGSKAAASEQAPEPAGGPAAEATAEVTADHLWVRLGPDDARPHLDRALARGAKVRVLASGLGERGSWRRVHAEAWVHGDYVRDGAVIASSLHVRGAPAPTAPIVSGLKRGDPVAVEERRGEWLRVGCYVHGGYLRDDAGSASGARTEAAELGDASDAGAGDPALRAELLANVGEN